MSRRESEQSEIIRFYQRQNEIYKRENFLLKRTIRKALGYMNFSVPPEISLETEEEPSVRWSDKYKRYAGLRSQLLEVALILIRKTNAPVHQDKILSAFEKLYPKTYETTTNPGETLPRRLRELARNEWLVRPQQGYYFIGPKTVERQEKTELRQAMKAEAKH